MDMADNCSQKKQAPNHQAAVRDSLIALSASIATFEQMAILGEGNVSGQLDAETFLIKASGTQLSTLLPNQLVEVNSATVLAAMGEEEGASADDDSDNDADDDADDDVEALLLKCRKDPRALKPSVETLFHAWLLKLPGVAFVGHTHPIAVNQLLCSPRAQEFAERRLFPDQIVYCGKESVLIPYVDPGMTLSRRIAQEVLAFIDRIGYPPKTILLENHGLIALGETANQVEAALLMAEKSARVFVGACTAGGPIFMPKEQVERIAARSDEHYRQKMLRGQVGRATCGVAATALNATALNATALNATALNIGLSHGMSG